MANGVEFNLPTIRVNLELVASWDGGLNDPSVLVLNSSSAGNDEAPLKRAKFRYPFMHGIQQPWQCSCSMSYY